MDPYRNDGNEPFPPEEPARDEEPEEEPGHFFMRRFRRKWIALSVLAFVLAAGLLVPGQIVALWALTGGSGKAVGFALLVETIHAMVYLTPLWAWSVARDETRKESWGTDLGGWIVSGTLPRWFLWMVPASIPLSAGLLFWTGVEGFLIARMVYLIVWLSLCATAMGQIGLLRWTQTEDGKRALGLEDRHRLRIVETESLDARTERVQLLDDGRSVSWRLVSPLGRLERELRGSAKRV